MGQVRGTLEFLCTAQCPIPYPAQDEETVQSLPKVGHFTGKNEVRVCGQRLGGGKAGDGVVGEGTPALATARGFAGTQDYGENRGMQASAGTGNCLPGLPLWSEGIRTEIPQIHKTLHRQEKPSPQHSPLPRVLRVGGLSGSDPALGVAGCSATEQGLFIDNCLEPPPPKGPWCPPQRTHVLQGPTMSRSSQVLVKQACTH